MKHRLIIALTAVTLIASIAFAVQQTTSSTQSTNRVDYMPTLAKAEKTRSQQNNQQIKDRKTVAADDDEQATHAAAPLSTNANDVNKLASNGGPVETAPKIYLVFYGKEWSNDPNGMKTQLQSFYKGLYGSQDTWSSSLTQYCSGATVGAITCGSTNHVVHPSSNPLAGVWNYTGVSAPVSPTQTDLQNVAIKAAQHFNKTTQTANNNIQYVIATAHNHNQDGFGTQWCGWHSAVNSSYGTLAFTNLPYIPDATWACGAGFVNSPGTNDGISLIAGHEYAESVSDPFGNAWSDSGSSENADKCVWLYPGTSGGAINQTLSTGTFPVQALYSNTYTATGGCASYYNGANQAG